MRSASAAVRPDPMPAAPLLDSTSAPASVIRIWIWPSRSVGKYFAELEPKKPWKSVKSMVSSSMAASSVIAEWHKVRSIDRSLSRVEPPSLRMRHTVLY
eukprot:6176812-Pleurochrysis_carterae.AAC.1